LSPQHNQTSNDPISQVIVALDVDSVARARELAQLLRGTGCWLKIGLELYALSGVSLIDEFKNLGFNIFLDLKLHDIPTTVERALRVLAGAGADMINVHCLGGYEMMARAADVCHEKGTTLIGVTVLTSMNQQQLESIGVPRNVDDQVSCLAHLACRAGLDGIVASAQEVPMLRKQFDQKDFLLVTPGIRPVGSAAHDQARVLTPKAALEAGSSYLVIGRPITKSEEPLRVLRELFPAVIPPAPA
jgi:orotidine-5'-phosphate decarboxylase